MIILPILATRENNVLFKSFNVTSWQKQKMKFMYRKTKIDWKKNVTGFISFVCVHLYVYVYKFKMESIVIMLQH